MPIYDKLIQLRRERGYSQEQLANMLNVSRQAVSKWESGNSVPELEKLVTIADIYGVSLDYLVRDNIICPDQTKPDAAGLENGNVMLQLDEINQYIKKQNLYEYKSKRKVFGIHLVHIKLVRNGIAVARGIVAIGNVSIGLISIGGIALGLIGIGGIAFGAFALAGLAVGGIAFGAVSVGIAALGGVSIGVYAAGGVALASKIAIGGVASGSIAIGQVADGNQVLHIDTATREQIKAVILEQYPGTNKILLKLILTFIKYS